MQLLLTIEVRHFDGLINRYPCTQFIHIDYVYVDRI